MVNYSIESAKSARSSCKKCKGKIMKDEIRVGITVQGGDFDQTSWVHISCFTKSKQGANQDIEEIDGYNSLTLVQKSSVQKEVAKIQKDAKKNTKKKGSKKQESSDEDEPEDSESDDDKKKPVSKKGGKASGNGAGGALAGYTPSERETYKKHLEEFEQKSVAALKLLLKQNGMTQAGNKSEVTARVADCKTLGTLPNCSKCGGGRLKFDQKAGTYFCKGYMDDTEFINCSAKFPRNEITRGTWAD